MTAEDRLREALDGVALTHQDFHLDEVVDRIMAHPTVRALLDAAAEARPVMEHVEGIAQSIRESGDSTVVLLSADGVTRTCVTVADELWLAVRPLAALAALDQEAE